MIACGLACARLLRRDLGVRVGHREDDRLVRHQLDHVLRQRALRRQAEEHVGPLQRVRQRARVRGRGVAGLPLVHALGAALVDHALGVAQQHVLGPHAHRLEQLDAGDGRGPGAVDHQPGVLQLALGEEARVDQAGGRDDGGAVLVVVEHRDVHQLAQALLDDEALGRLDVLEVDAAEARAEVAHAVHELVHVLRVDAQVDPVDVGEALEQRDLALHHRLGRERPEVAEAQHGGAVRHHRDHVAPWWCTRRRGPGPGGCAGTARRRPANTPGDRSRAVVSGLLIRVSSLPGRPLACIASASSADTRAVRGSMLPSAICGFLP